MNRIGIFLLTLCFSLNAQSTEKQRTADASQTATTAARMQTTSKTHLAPVYPYLAEYLVARFQLQGKVGTGIDIGGGSGILVRELAQRTKNFYWINTDINPEFASYFLPEIAPADAHRFGFLAADVHQLPFRTDFADLIVSRGSFQFWENKPQAFAEIYRVLKPGGWAFIGRGFSENLPVEIAKKVRANQSRGFPKYDPAETATELHNIMKELKIEDFEIMRPHISADVNYGIWLIFSKRKN